MRSRALIIGRHVDYVWQLPSLLHQCRYTVDLVMASPGPLTEHPLIDRHHPVPGDLLSAALDLTRQGEYDWVIPSDNPLLHQLAHRIDIPVAERLRIAPVTASEHLGHLASKAGLSRRLAAAGIRTPEFAVVVGPEQARQAADEWGYPVVAKLDSSAGGRGVVIARSAADLDHPLFARRRILMQRYHEGRDLGLNALFLGGELVHLSMGLGAHRRTRTGEWSILRLMPTARHPEVVAEVDLLGRVLGIDGFANVTALLDGEGRRWYIEADTRPNVWSTRGAEVGDDPIPRLRAHREGRRGPMMIGDDLGEFDAAYFPRLSAEDIAADRFGVLGQIPADDPVARYLMERVA